MIYYDLNRIFEFYFTLLYFKGEIFTTTLLYFKVVMTKSSTLRVLYFTLL